MDKLRLQTIGQCYTSHATEHHYLFTKHFYDAKTNNLWPVIANFEDEFVETSKQLDHFFPSCNLFRHTWSMTR